MKEAIFASFFRIYTQNAFLAVIQ